LLDAARALLYHERMKEEPGRSERPDAVRAGRRDEAGRKDRLKAALKANIARRKAQAKARDKPGQD